MLSMATRLQSWRKVRAATVTSSRTFRGSSSDGAWRNDTPAGSNTEVFVYNPEFNIAWPDSQLGVVARKDKNFNLPGNIGANPTGSLDQLQIPPPSKQPDILSTPTVKESQVHALYNANDFIRYTAGSDRDVFASPRMLRDFPSLPSNEMMDLKVHTAPTLLRKELGDLFPEEDLTAGPLSIITMSILTEQDMSTWSEEVEAEREKLTEHTVISCKEICGRLKEDGYWADFIDPCSGTPHFSGHTNTTMFETDEKFRLLGFRIEDLGCCKVISHAKFGRHVFVGCIVTNAAAGSDAVDNIVEDISPYYM
eukprot:GFUD01027732.1.p1 GENE.GFUD01027732.1~~GFUD01027732.1.p1  ORF type:complete len:309 (-),score=86.41 GFUD01027732.1:567-1493(-)